MNRPYITIERNQYGVVICTCLVNFGEQGTGLVSRQYYGYSTREAIARFLQYVQELRGAKQPTQD